MALLLLLTLPDLLPKLTRLPVCVAVMAFNVVLLSPLMDTWLRFDTGNANFVYFNLLSLTVFFVLLIGELARVAALKEDHQSGAVHDHQKVD